MNTDPKLTLAALVVFVLLIGLSIGWTASVWSECRKAGHPRLYCARLVSK